MSSLYKGESKDIAVWRIREKVLSQSMVGGFYGVQTCYGSIGNAYQSDKGAMAGGEVLKSRFQRG